jgi:methionine-rich copper-binding protein CopC
MKTLLPVVALLALASPVAFAHTELSSSLPADKAMLHAAPTDVTLRFSEPVRLTMLSIQKKGDAKRDLGPLPKETSAQFAAMPPTLDAGDYVVTWRALSDDAHVMTGEFTFTVMAVGAHDELTQAH